MEEDPAVEDDDVVTLALRKARYNEIVQIEVKRGDDEDDKEGGATSEEVCLVACLDETHGGIQWNPLQLDTPESRIQRHLQTKQWVIPMLNDRRRNELYQQAIVKAVDALRQDPANEEPTTVLDIGTGTGLLSMMVAQTLTKSGRSIETIQALEMSTAMAALAKRVINDNQLQNHINVTTVHSSGLQTTQLAHLCVSELLESGLLGEGLLPSLRDAWGRLLRPHAIMIPQGIRVYAAVLEGEWLLSYHPATLLNNKEEGLSYRSMSDASTTATAPSVPVAVPIHADKLLRDGCLRLLTEAECVLVINLDRKERLPSERGQNTTVSTLVRQSGTAHAILVWWDLDLWRGQTESETTISYSMKPGAEPFQDHWHQCLHIPPYPVNVAAGNAVTLRASHNDLRVQVALLEPGEEVESVSSAKRARWDTNVAFSAATWPFSPQRVFQLNDSQRQRFYQDAISRALAALETDVHVLDVSDFSWCACLSAKAGCHRVTSLESSTCGTLANLAARLAQDSDCTRGGACQFEILACHIENLSLEAIGGTPMTLLVSEPYYEILEGWPLLEALNYYYMVRFLRTQGIVSTETTVIPARCRIMVCAIESEQLRAAYRCCGDREGSSHVCGLDHTALTELRTGHRTLLSLPMWQIDYRALTANFEIASLLYDTPSHDDLRFSSELVVREGGRVDAVMVWLEYQCGRGNDVQTYSTNCRSYQQQVHVVQGSLPNFYKDADVTSVGVQLDFGGLDNNMDYRINVRLNYRESGTS